jgi:hypothetical protein
MANPLITNRIKFIARRYLSPQQCRPIADTPSWPRGLDRPALTGGTSSTASIAFAGSPIVFCRRSAEWRSTVNIDGDTRAGLGGRTDEERASPVSSATRNHLIKGNERFVALNSIARP